MTITLYFAVKDGAYDPETGESVEAGMKVTLEGISSPEEEAELVRQIEQLHCGQLRQISEEEYRRDYEDED